MSDIDIQDYIKEEQLYEEQQNKKFQQSNHKLDELDHKMRNLIKNSRQGNVYYRERRPSVREFQQSGVEKFKECKYENEPIKEHTKGKSMLRIFNQKKRNPSEQQQLHPYEKDLSREYQQRNQKYEQNQQPKGRPSVNQKVTEITRPKERLIIIESQNDSPFRRRKTSEENAIVFTELKKQNREPAQQRQNSEFYRNQQQLLEHQEKQKLTNELQMIEKMMLKRSQFKNNQISQLKQEIEKIKQQKLAIYKKGQQLEKHQYENKGKGTKLENDKILLERQKAYEDIEKWKKKSQMAKQKYSKAREKLNKNNIEVDVLQRELKELMKIVKQPNRSITVKSHENCPHTRNRSINHSLQKPNSKVHFHSSNIPDQQPKPTSSYQRLTRVYTNKTLAPCSCSKSNKMLSSHRIVHLSTNRKGKQRSMVNGYQVEQPPLTQQDVLKSMVDQLDALKTVVNKSIKKCQREATLRNPSTSSLRNTKVIQSYRCGSNDAADAGNIHSIR